MKEHIKIAIIDDHAMVRTGLRMVLETRPHLKVVGEAANIADGLVLYLLCHPDIVLLDADLKGEDGLSLIEPLLADSEGKVRILVVTGLSDMALHQRSLKLGANGLILKEKAGELLLRAVDRVMAGEFWFDRATMGALLAEYSRQKVEDPETRKIASLTQREHEVIKLVGEGLRNKAIADRLFISETTVRHHLTSIFDKLGVMDRLELVIYAFRHQLAQIPH